MARVNRRTFLKGIACGAGVLFFPYVFSRRSYAAPWQAGSRFHPNVDDLRVVGIIDEKMTREKKVRIPWKKQNELVVDEVVWADMDKLACALTGQKRPEDAWKAIFVKPPRKSFSDAVVAVKVNNIGAQHTRNAVMVKLCRVLVDVCGVKASNIYIFDAKTGGNMGRKTPFYGLPAGCNIAGSWGGITVPVKVAAPYSGSAKCNRHIAEGKVDIMVNIAMCKGHSARYGKVTMTMKNHLGTFDPRPAHSRKGLEYLIGINKTSQVLGETDASGRIVYPRQQLCIVDGLWASKPGPGGPPTAQPNFLAMGVLSPVVDYLVGTQFRASKMGWQVNEPALRRMVKEFGHDVAGLKLHYVG